MAISPDVERLISAAPERLPLTHSTSATVDVALGSAAALFPGARAGQAALAGLLLRIGNWAESHAVAQDIETVEGSYWHGILHRMEPDASNAGYWFRRVGTHPIFPELRRQANRILHVGGPGGWWQGNTWDPLLFIEWCDEAREKGGREEAVAVAIQMAEWQLLFEWCTS